MNDLIAGVPGLNGGVILSFGGGKYKVALGHERDARASVGKEVYVDTSESVETGIKI